MMTKQEIEGQWEFARLVFANARRQIDKIPDDRLDFRPVEEVRSIGELAVHMHQFLTDATESVLAGKHVEGKEPVFTKKADLLKWADEQVAKGYSNLSMITETQLQQTIVAYGEKFPGWQLLSMVPTEAIHHRGQLMVYLRLMGIEPIFAYDFSA